MIAIIVFGLTYAAIISEKINRTVVAFLGCLALVAFKVFTVEEAVGYISWDTIGLIFGMFLIVAALSEAGFFTYLALVIAKMLKYSPTLIFIVFPILTAILSAFMDSITVMLFFATLTYELCTMLKVDATPLIITEVILANIGGTATLVGNPPNVILGVKLGFYFNDFVIHNGPICIIAGAAALTFCYLVSKKSLKPKEPIDKEQLCKMDPKEAIEDMKQLKISLGAFCGALVLLITHTYLEGYLGIPITVPLAAMIPAFIMLVFLGKKSEEIIMKVDYELILFFMALFVVVGGLEHTETISRIGEFITQAFQGNEIGLLSTLVWGSGIASGVVDNVPFALSMAYILDNMVKFVGVPALSIMLWATSLGANFGGNLTPIGASANVVAYGSMRKRGHPIGWGRWLKLAIPATIISLVVSNVAIYLKYIIGFY